MDDLVQWLRAQLDEDERIARAAARLKSGRLDEKWVVEHHVVWPSTWGENENPITASGVLDPVTGITHGAAAARAAHVAEWDPARVLREIDAKRQLINWVRKWPLRTHTPASVDGVLELLALPYADRPGYREEWRP